MSRADNGSSCPPWEAFVVGVMTGRVSAWFSRSPSGNRIPYISRRPALYIGQIDVFVVPVRYPRTTTSTGRIFRRRHTATLGSG